MRRIAGAWAGARAMLFRNGGHLVDTINWFAGSEPEWVVGILDHERQDQPPRYAGDGGKDPRTEPGGTGLVRYKNDVRAFVNCSKGITGGGVELEVFCERGHLRVDDVSAAIVRVPPGGSSHDRSWEAVPSVVTSLGENPSRPRRADRLRGGRARAALHRARGQLRPRRHPGHAAVQRRRPRPRPFPRPGRLTHHVPGQLPRALIGHTGRGASATAWTWPSGACRGSRWWPAPTPTRPAAPPP